MRQSERVQSGAEESDMQSREGAWSAIPPTPRSRFQNLNAANPFLFELNRQIPELETPLSLRKQRTANRSNRQKSSSLATSYSSLTTSAAIANRRTLNLAERNRPTANFPKMGLAKYRPISREPKDGTIAQKGPLATSHSPLTTRISNRELLGLEILQLTENKDHRPVLIANFEPNDFFDFQAYVAAAFRRAGFPLSPGALEQAGRSGKLSQPNGCPK
jgi:hypothetical protein